MHQNTFGGRAPPGPGELMGPPDSLAAMEGTISEGRKGRGGSGRKGPIYKRREGACYLVGFISKGTELSLIHI